MEIIERYFPGFEGDFGRLERLYTEWNSRINVISRKDMEHFWERHVLHSLSLAKVRDFKAGTKVLDIGTGGGFPGIPLAIMFPEAHFTLVDSIGKKISVVRGVAEALDLKNVVAIHGRAEDLEGSFDIVVSRAVAPMSTLIEWAQGKLVAGGEFLVLKGGDLTAELEAARHPYTLYDIANFFDGEFFATKKIVRIGV